MTQPAEAVTRQTVEYFLQCQQPDGTWEGASGYTDDLNYGYERLAKRRQVMPEFQHRLACRTTTVVVQPMPEVRPAPAVGDVVARTGDPR